MQADRTVLYNDQLVGVIAKIREIAGPSDFTSYTPKMIGDFIEANYDLIFMNEEEYERRYGNA